MSIDKRWPILWVILAVVLLFNSSLIFSLPRGKTDLVPTTLRVLRLPCKEEDKALADLKTRIENLTKED